MATKVGNLTVQFTDNSRQILETMRGAKTAALLAMGIKGKNLIIDEIDSHYPRLFDTGEMRKTTDWGSDGVVGKIPTESVDMGSPKTYSKFVHEGTSRITGIPFIKDAILNNIPVLQSEAEKTLASKFK